MLQCLNMFMTLTTVHCSEYTKGSWTPLLAKKKDHVHVRIHACMHVYRMSYFLNSKVIGTLLQQNTMSYLVYNLGYFVLS